MKNLWKNATGYLCNWLPGLFRRRAWPDQEILDSFEHRLPTSTGRDFIISGNLEKCEKSSNNHYGYIVSINISGAQHPHDPSCLSGAVGDFNKNPALVPALQYSRDVISQILRAVAEQRGISDSLEESFDVGNPTMDSLGAGWLARFNPFSDYLKRENYVPASRQLVTTFFSDCKERIARILPRVQQEIDANAHLEPVRGDSAGQEAHWAGLGNLRADAMVGNPSFAQVATTPSDMQHWLDVAEMLGKPTFSIAEPADGGYRVLDCRLSRRGPR